MTAPTAGRFVNSQRQVVAWLSDPDRALPDGTAVGTRVPAHLDGLRFVWVQRRPGISRYITSTVRVEVHCFAPNEDSGWALAGAVHAAVLDLGGSAIAGQLYDHVRCPADPVEQFWSPTVFRTVAVYELDLRVTA